MKEEIKYYIARENNKIKYQILIDVDGKTGTILGSIDNEILEEKPTIKEYSSFIKKTIEADIDKLILVIENSKDHKTNIQYNN